MHSVMKLTLSKLMSGRSPGELSAGLKQLLKHYVYLQGTQGNQKKVHVHMCVRTFMMQLFSELFPLFMCNVVLAFCLPVSND